MFANILKDTIGPIIDGFLKLIPDKNKRAEAREKLQSDMLVALTGLIQGQIQINMKEAQHGSIFVAGWRPFIGWTCGVGLGWEFVLEPMLTWIVAVSGADLPVLPTLDTGPLMSLVLGMLGLGGLRTYEKQLGIARTGLNPVVKK